MPEYVRVRQDETGHEITVLADSDMTGLTVIKKPALDQHGEPAPMKPKTTVAKKASAKAQASAAADDTGHEAATSKES